MSYEVKSSEVVYKGKVFNIEKDVDPSKAYEVIDQFLTKFASSKPDGVEIMLISYSH